MYIYFKNKRRPNTGACGMGWAHQSLFFSNQVSSVLYYILVIMKL